MTEQQTREEYAEQVRRQSSVLYSLLARGKIEEAMGIADTLTREAFRIVQAAKMTEEVEAGFDLSTLPKPKDLPPDEDTESPFYED